MGEAALLCVVSARRHLIIVRGLVGRNGLGWQACKDRRHLRVKRLRHSGILHCVSKVSFFADPPEGIR